MENVPDTHRAHAESLSAKCAILTCSDTRTPETDTSGDLMEELLLAGGHTVVARRIVSEDPGRVFWALHQIRGADAILLNGGTGIAPRDGTVEAARSFMDRELPGFGELFRMLSFDEIGAAAMLSRAVAGTRGTMALFATPGSPKAVRLAMTRLILPELKHVIRLLHS